MRKFLSIILSAAGILCLSACNKSETSASISNVSTYTVTFVQPGQSDIVKTVEEGGTLTEIPEVKKVTGYTVTWEEKALTDIKSDITVNAIKTPNKYTVTYDANGGILFAASDIFTYDAEYTLKTPEREDYTFVCWKKGSVSMALTGTWKTAENVTLTAAWEKEVSETYTITFIQEGQADVIKTIDKGEILTDIPEPVSVPGYEIIWDRTDFTGIMNNTTVTAIATAQTYTITYDLGILKNDGGVNIAATTQQVTYDTEYNLFKPMCKGYFFKEWRIEGTETRFENGTYKNTGDITLVALWEEDIESERWWTKFY